MVWLARRRIDGLHVPVYRNDLDRVRSNRAEAHVHCSEDDLRYESSVGRSSLPRFRRS